mmetsp:Transcript_7868/g.22632  ORF Transcript_7868/g.22632 Transcript_7868/m.22632 type:complete len:162 (+) Transcript_7868:189-674(+)
MCKDASKSSAVKHAAAQERRSQERERLRLRGVLSDPPVRRPLDSDLDGRTTLGLRLGRRTLGERLRRGLGDLRLLLGLRLRGRRTPTPLVPRPPSRRGCTSVARLLWRALLASSMRKEIRVPILRPNNFASLRNLESLMLSAYKNKLFCFESSWPSICTNP